MKPMQSDLKAGADAFAARLARWRGGEGETRASLRLALRALITQVRIWLMKFATHTPLPPAPKPRTSARQTTPPRRQQTQSTTRASATPRFGFSLIEPAPGQKKSRIAPQTTSTTVRMRTDDDIAGMKFSLRFDALCRVIANPRPAIAALRRKLARAKAPVDAHIKNHPSTDFIESPPRNRADRRRDKAKARRESKNRQRRDSG